MATEKLKQIALLITQSAQQADNLPKDGFQVTDLFGFFPQLGQIGVLIREEKENHEILAEIKNVTSAERKELVTFVEDNLTLTNKRTEKIIESGFAAIIAVYGFIEAIKAPKEEEETPTV